MKIDTFDFKFLNKVAMVNAAIVCNYENTTTSQRGEDIEDKNIHESRKFSQDVNNVSDIEFQNIQIDLFAKAKAKKAQVLEIWLNVVLSIDRCPINSS